jgi:hypothetical protein
MLSTAGTAGGLCQQTGWLVPQLAEFSLPSFEEQAG